MKISRTVLAILILSTLVWVFFYLATPSTPPDEADSIVIVGGCALVVYLAKALRRRLKKRRE